jgi:5-methyltetrahydrofolate--homocysteine methyltransferase
MDLEILTQKVIEGNISELPVLVEQALRAGASAEEILNRALIPGMIRVGQLYTCGEYYVPEMLKSARAMKAAIVILQPYLVQSHMEPLGRMVIGSVKGDMHDIGKTLVSLMVQGAGVQVIDLGIDVAPEKFVEAVRTQSPQVVGMSALLTTTMTQMKTTIDALQEAGLRDAVKIIVGGAPLNEEYAREIGADLYARDAAEAARRVRALLSHSPVGV